MRERDLQWSLLFVVKVKRPWSEVRGKASSDHGGGKAVGVCCVKVGKGGVCFGEAVKAGYAKAACDMVWRSCYGTARRVESSRGGQG
jgi:hypothetical protein